MRQRKTVVVVVVVVVLAVLYNLMLKITQEKLLLKCELKGGEYSKQHILGYCPY